ncbi:hypothetical protein [Saccharothrix syringae]|nr:hypothetical protein [Saccharothrix syringae]
MSLDVVIGVGADVIGAVVGVVGLIIAARLPRPKDEEDKTGSEE